MANPVWNAFLEGQSRGVELNALAREKAMQDEALSRRSAMGNALAMGGPQGYTDASRIALQGGDIETGLAVRQAGQQEQQQGYDRIRAGAPAVVQGLEGLLKLPEAQRAVAAQQLIPKLQQAGIDTSQMDGDFSDAGLQGELQGWRALIPQPEPMTEYQRAQLGQGADRIALDRDKFEADQARGPATSRIVDGGTIRPELAGFQVEVREDGKGGVDYNVLTRPQGEYTTQQRNDYTRRAAVIRDFEGAIDAYDQAVQELGTIPFYGRNNPQAARLEGLQTNVLILAKELFNLGVLNGPDLEILERQVRPATGMGSLIHGRESIGASLGTLRDYAARGMNQIPDEFRVGPDSAPTSSGGAQIPQGALDLLMSDPSPEAQREFDEEFGPGAAASVLGGG